MDACEATGGSSTVQKIQVYVALKREVCVRTDLVKSITTDPTKQAARSGQARSSDPAVFNQMIKKTAVPLPVIPAFSHSLSFTLISKPPSIIDLIPRFLSL